MKKIVLILFMFFMVSFIANAATGELICSETDVVEKDTFSCDLYLTSEEELTSFTGSINYSSNHFNLTSIAVINDWSNGSTTGLELTTEGSGITTRAKVATLNFKVKENITSGSQTISVISEDLSNTVSDSVKILSINNKLSSLAIVGKSFAFNATTNTYTMTVSSKNIIILATLNDSKASFVDGYGPRSVTLEYGKVNNIEIKVKAESGTVNTYTLKLTLQDNRNTDNTLKSLAISQGTLKPMFSASVTSYNAEVDSTVNDIVITAVANNSKASFVEGYASRTVALVTGSNTFEIKVQAENGEIKTYTLNVVKNVATINTYLKSITLTTGTVEFDKNTYDYNINVTNETTEMVVSAEAEDTTAKVKVTGNKVLEVGANNYKIEVTGSDNSVRTYTVVVNRLEAGETLSSNNYLTAIEIANYSINFDKETLNYNLSIKNEDSLNINYTKEDETAVVQIIGNSSLKNNSIIKINVTSEDGNLRTYQITVAKEFDRTNLAIIILAVIIVALSVVIFIIKKGQKAKQPKKDEFVPLKGSKLVIKNKDKQADLGKKEETTIPEVEEPEQYQEK